MPFLGWGRAGVGSGPVPNLKITSFVLVWLQDLTPHALDPSCAFNITKAASNWGLLYEPISSSIEPVD